MKTIRKQTADLKFGDVVFSSSRPDVVFVRFLPSPPPPISGMLATAACDRFVELLEQDGSTKSVYFPASVEVVSNLTPAQRHADELLALVRNQVTTPQRQGGFEYDAQKLLDMIDPPKPVTLDEALAMVLKMHEGRGDREESRTLLDRARRSGVLK